MHYVCHLSDKVSLLHALMITYALGKSMEIDINELITNTKGTDVLALSPCNDPCELLVCLYLNIQNKLF